jgi:hypothetical protein
MQHFARLTVVVSKNLRTEEALSLENLNDDIDLGISRSQ